MADGRGNIYRIAFAASGAAVLGGFVAVQLRSRRRAQPATPIRLLKEPPREPRGPLASLEKWHDLPEWIVFKGQRGPRQNYPILEDDPLFNDNGDPCLFPMFPPASRSRGKGAAIVCPGGNYEFLGNHEAEPIARWLAEELGIEAYVLKYRLLPWATLAERQEDLHAAVREVRHRIGADGGPIMAIGFSAGGHLVASASAEGKKGETTPDAIALIYGQVDPEEWGDADRAGFWQTDVQTAQVRSCQIGREKLLKGPHFVAPPSLFIASSVGDDIVPPSLHTDLYAVAAEEAGVAVTMLRGDFGGHGFGLKDFWAAPCIEWLKRLGFGRDDDA